MRWLILLAVAACSPDIPSGTYLCGPEQSCPVDQACNGSDNTCVIAALAKPFACLPNQELEPDNSPAMATDIGALGCVSTVFSQKGCLAAGDANDWYKLTAPTGCTALAIDIRVNYPVAFEPLGLVLADAAGAQIATDGPCKTPSGNDADDERCIVQTITPGATYTFAVKPAGGGDCDGTCNYNRYTLAVQLETP
jgi:hypothetical protein